VSKPSGHPGVEFVFRQNPSGGHIIKTAINFLADIDVVLDIFQGAAEGSGPHSPQNG
jgi:hypothetical protein